MAKTATAPAKPKVELPDDLTFDTAPADFQPISQKAANNPVMQAILNADVGAWYLFPDEANTDDAVKGAIESRLRSAAQTLRVGMSLRKDTNGRWAWKVTGPVVPRPRKAKAA